MHPNTATREVFPKGKWNEFSPLLKNKIMPFAATWMELEIVTLSEVSRTQKDKYHMIALICRN